MKSLHVRFVLYCTVGLLLFLVYFILVFTALNNLVYPDRFMLLSYESISGMTLFIFLVCFASGGLLFSLLIVQPLSRIIRVISEQSKGKYETAADAFMKNGKVKWYYFLYQEVMLNLVSLGSHLQKADLEQKEMEQAKNEWLAGVSHDLKTPLSYINGYSSLLLNQTLHFSAQEKATYLNEIYQKGSYIESLINDLNLSFFFDGVEKMQLRYSQLEMVAFLQRTLTDAANDSRAEKFLFEYNTQLKRRDVVLDERLMYRALYNLLMNAVEHNPEGTTITINFEEITDGLIIQVSDNGIGMDTATCSHIFDKYFSSTKQKQGKGLGLFVVKQIVEALGGTLSVVSEVGKGTTFCIELRS
ncbi:HAMP domain-containing sensor histidine kinase [uncultured Enterococcus sp.]|uniref:sensor histidine kinase n=1 Tax=uncultured Enterococcus sp. TaxID=167972 RepID=UPI002AA8F02D|nr:HAMP domain-containing sensor histidine kinase [uncultured Enterococcus sp.]